MRRNDPARKISMIRQKINAVSCHAMTLEVHRLRQREVNKVRVAMWQQNMDGVKTLDGELLWAVNQ